MSPPVTGVSPTENRVRSVSAMTRRKKVLACRLMVVNQDSRRPAFLATDRSTASRISPKSASPSSSRLVLVRVSWATSEPLVQELAGGLLQLAPVPALDREDLPLGLLLPINLISLDTAL